MPTLFVMYPPPADVATFDKRYKQEHLPMAGENLKHVKGLAIYRGVASPGAPKAAFHAIAAVEFASTEDLQADLESPGGQKTAAHAVEISTGGPPVFVICEKDG